MLGPADRRGGCPAASVACRAERTVEHLGLGHGHGHQADSLASAPDRDLFVNRWYLAFARPHSSGQMMTA